MPVKKTPKPSSRGKKTVLYKKKVTTRPVAKKNKLISFLVGVFTVLAIGILLFQYAQGNNYKEVLGENTIESTK